MAYKHLGGHGCRFHSDACRQRIYEAMKQDSHELDRMIRREELMGRVIQEKERMCRPGAADVDRLAGPSSTEGSRDVEKL